ncbi:HAD family phosphatase [Synechococcus sp. CCY9201]|uniref:HAD family hydrolase n=1 Tax=unclassified Synechococcus TaxID=2626047 RepID=UPI002AD2F9DB|nr:MULTISPECIES: HAD family phosphatase [unclassified Synechococcus]MEA5473901.1 HAD family phosphatase [Synechococcus sp. CCY9201]CAK6695976.1 Fructose-1-phosphate phosphatase YqaB [Synechococcus sp. CBW1107]
MPPPAACLFDLDGLLLDTEPLHGRAWREAACHFGGDLTEAQLLDLRGRRRLDCAEQVRSLLPGSVSVEALLAVRQPIAEALLGQALPMAGAPELVQRCHQLGIPMALATSSAEASVAIKAAPHPWLSLIVERVYGDDPELRQGKPAPDIFQLAAQRLGVNPGDCWAFEDSQAGCRSALAAGCHVHVLVPPGSACTAYPAGVVCLTSLEQVHLS